MVATSRNVLSRQSAARTGAERQKRWRHRQRVRRQAAEALRRRLGREPTAGELREAVEAELAALGLGREATGPDEAVVVEGDEGDGDRAAGRATRRRAAADRARVRAGLGRVRGEDRGAAR